MYERYANPQFFFDMEIEEGVELINHIYEKKREEKAYQLYTSIYPNMTTETYIPFEDFYKPEKQGEETEDVRTVEDILNDVKDVLDSRSWR